MQNFKPGMIVRDLDGCGDVAMVAEVDGGVVSFHWNGESGKGQSGIRLRDYSDEAAAVLFEQHPDEDDFCERCLSEPGNSSRFGCSLCGAMVCEGCLVDHGPDDDEDPSEPVCEECF